MNPAGFLFRSLLLAAFTLSLLAGAILTDYYLRHEVTRQARQFLAERGVELAPDSAIEAAREGEVALLENLELAGMSLGVADDRGFTPLLAAVEGGHGPAIDFLMGRIAVRRTINRGTELERRTPLAVALADRNFALADRLIAAGADLRVDREPGVPFLVHAIDHGDAEMVDYLLEKGVDPTYRGARTAGALALARHRGEFALMERLLEAGADPDARGVTGKPLLIEAVEEGNREHFDLLLAAGADADARIGQSTGPGMSALSFAVARGDVGMQEALLERKVETDVRGTGGEPLLVEVVAGGDRDTARRLLSAGASANAVSPDGVTPLASAVRADDLDSVELLLEHGADPSLAPEGRPAPLLLAVRNRNVPVAHQLIIAGAGGDWQPMLVRAYEMRDDPLLNLLLHAGADPESTFPGSDRRVFDAAVHDGATAAVRTFLAAGVSIGDNLWAALLTGQDDLIRLILEAGADPRQEGPEGQDPLDYCLARGRYEAARTLLAGGADPDVRFDEDETWLTKSVREGNADIARALLKAGARVEGVETRDGHTLLGWAIAHEMTDVVVALLEAGADPDGVERTPAHEAFREQFDSTTFSYHLRVDRRIRPIMMAAAQRNHEIAQALMDAGADGRAYTPRYLMAASIAAWYKDSDMQQIALLGEVPEVQPRKIVVDLSSQRVTLYENGVATYSTRCSTGKSGYGTPTGNYVISDRHRHHTSTIYDASMPYFQRFSYSAFGIHEGYVPNYPASHGCIRLPHDGASYLFGKLEVGDAAVVQH